MRAVDKFNHEKDLSFLPMQLGGLDRQLQEL